MLHCSGHCYQERDHVICSSHCYQERDHVTPLESDFSTPLQWTSAELLEGCSKVAFEREYIAQATTTWSVIMLHCSGHCYQERDHCHR